jgi:hypothetical protein
MFVVSSGVRVESCATGGALAAGSLRTAVARRTGAQSAAAGEALSRRGAGTLKAAATGAGSRGACRRCERDDLGAGRVGLGLERVDLGVEGGDLGIERGDLTPWSRPAVTSQSMAAPAARASRRTPKPGRISRRSAANACSSFGR